MAQSALTQKPGKAAPKSTKTPKAKPRAPARSGKERLQAKLRSGEVGDAQEREADRIAAELVKPAAPIVVQAAPAPTATAPASGPLPVQPIATEARPVQGMPVSPEVEAKIAALSGGAALPASVRANLEPRLGRDLGNVRVHTGSAARDLTDQAGALAVTVGRDIAFAPGAYRPHTPDGQRLMAHELVHVVQQDAVGARVQRTPAPDAALRQAMPRSEGELVGDDRIVFTSIRIPAFKLAGHRGLLYEGQFQNEGTRLGRARGYDRDVRLGTNDHNRQVTLWHQGVRGRLAPAVEAKIAAAYAVEGLARRSRWVLGVPGPSGRVYIQGTLSSLVRELGVPTWGGHGSTVQPKEFQVDHIVELQLAMYRMMPGHYASTTANMELLEAAANGESGRQIQRTLYEQAALHLAGWESRKGSDPPMDLPQLLRTYDIGFEHAEPDEGSTVVTRQDYWTFDEIADGAHLADVRVADPSFLSGGGPGEVTVRWDEGDSSWISAFAWHQATTEATAITGREARGGVDAEQSASVFVFTQKRFDTASDEPGAQLGSLWLNLPENSEFERLATDVEVPVRRLEDARYAGVIDPEPMLAAMQQLKSKSMSPIHFDDLRWVAGTGIVGNGKVATNEENAEGVSGMFAADRPVGPTIHIEGARHDLAGTIGQEELAPPGPIEVTHASIAFTGNQETGPAVSGEIGVRVRDFGEGSLRAELGEHGLALDGSLSIDSPWFREATLEFAYDREHGLSGGGRLVLDTHGIPHLHGAAVTAHIENGAFSVDGELSFRGFGFEQQLLLGYSSERGFSVGGRVPIPAGRLPGLGEGFIEATVLIDPEGAMSLGGHGRIVPALPGFTGAIDVSYADGVLRAQGEVGTSHENLDGSITLGVTNEALDAEGAPSGTADGDTLRVFGGGRVQAQFGRFVRGEVGLELTPDAEVVVDGEIGLADELPLFERMGVHRDVLEIGLDIPIAGVRVLGRGIGIFATVGGGVDADAWFGPGVLRNVAAGVHFEFAHPENTVITGSAEFYVPAYAGLRVYAFAGVGASALVVDLTGRLELGATLGVMGEARARVDMRWTPNEGLAVNALAEAIATPKLAFDITGRVVVDSVLGVVWEKAWELANYEFGSNMQFGVRFPVNFQEGQPFEISERNVEFIVPTLDPDSMLEGVLRGTGRRED